MSARIESGVLQFGDDWPGVFFRGDTALGFANSLQRVIEALEFTSQPELRIALAVVHGLMAELQACDVRLHQPVTKLKPAEECLHGHHQG
jgi:hypothetical protein